MLALQQLLPLLLSKVSLKRSNVKHKTAHPFDIFYLYASYYSFLSVYIYACGRVEIHRHKFVAVYAYIYITDRQTDGGRGEGGRGGERKRGIKARKTFKEEEKKVLTVRSHPWEHETGRRILI